MTHAARDVKDKVIQYSGRYQLVLVAGTTDTYDLVAVPGTITEAGTAINKSYLQPLEDNLAIASVGATIYQYNKIGGAL